MPPPIPTLPRALLFDMDGTLTEPLLDFPRIKADMGIGSRPILEALAAMETGDRVAAETILHRHEEHAADNSTLNRGCLELLRWVRSARLTTALITRNTRRSVRTVLDRHQLSFDVLVTREDARHKPHPEPLHFACTALKISPGEAWMIGDGQYDVEAGIAAGVKTVWISHDRLPEFAAQPWLTVRDLPELTAVLQGCLSAQ